ncbi:MAG: FixH family protein [Betaproteobacteria bacterium]|nr:FixH family protein [Betaproteobacteria bacterium]
MTAPTITAQPSRPWYRETWPWLLMLGPAIVVVAGFITLYYAIVSFDGMVADDYYKRGLTVNQDISRLERAKALGITAQLTHEAAVRQVRATVAGKADFPATLTLRFMHPTRAGSDQRLTLNRVSPGRYEAALLLPPLSKWNVQLDGADWALAGEWTDTAQRALTLGTQP